MKGIIITALNRPALATKFNIDSSDDWDDLLPLGYIMIAEFGDGWQEGVMTSATFEEFFIKGETLQNGWFVVTRK